MKKLLSVFLWLLCVPAYAQFVPGQVLTAAQLNAQFALYAPLAGATFTGPLTQVSTGSFYAPAGRVDRLTDRVFVGDASQNLGTNAASQPDWLTQYQLAKGRTYGYVQTSQAAVLNHNASQDDLTTLVVGARNTSRTGGQVIAVTGMGVNNNPTGGVGAAAWAGYFEAFRDTSTAGNGGAYGIEIDTMNYVGSAAVTDPYAQSNDQTVGAQMASGGGFPGTLYPTTVGLNFQNNNATFDKGIVFGSNAITGATGSSGTGVAIALGLGHQLQWYGSAGVKTSSITGNGTTTAAGVGEVFQDNQIKWLNTGGNPLFSAINTTNGVNYLQAANNTAGNAPSLQAQGTDTNVILNLVPKGTGSVQVTSSAASGVPLVVAATSNTAGGAQIQLQGNGGTTPNKYLRSFNGVFQIVNSANSATPMSMDDAGNVTFTGTVAGSAVSGTPISGSTGSFTTLNASANDALLYQTSNAQSFSTGTGAIVTTWTKVFDRVNANFNASTGVFTAPATGYYQVSAQLEFAAATNVVNSLLQLSIFANGVNVAAGRTYEMSTGSNLNSVTVSATVSLTSGQTITVQGLQNSGSSRALSGVAVSNYLSINRLP